MSDTPEIAAAKRMLEDQAAELPNWARQLLDYIAKVERELAQAVSGLSETPIEGAASVRGGPWRLHTKGAGDSLWHCEDCGMQIWCNRTPGPWGHAPECRHAGAAEEAKRQRVYAENHRRVVAAAVEWIAAREKSSGNIRCINAGRELRSAVAALAKNPLPQASEEPTIKPSQEAMATCGGRVGASGSTPQESAGSSPARGAPSVHEINSAPTVLDPPMFGELEAYLRERKDLGEYDTNVLDPTHIRAADAIRDLRVALASQIEISNDLRRQIESRTQSCTKSETPRTDAIQSRACNETDLIEEGGGNPDTPERLKGVIQEAYDHARQLERNFDRAIADRDRFAARVSELSQENDRLLRHIGSVHQVGGNTKLRDAAAMLLKALKDAREADDGPSDWTWVGEPELREALAADDALRAVAGTKQGETP